MKRALICAIDWVIAIQNGNSKDGSQRSPGPCRWDDVIDRFRIRVERPYANM